MTFTTNPSIEESLVCLAHRDLDRCAEILGANADGRGLQIPFFDHTYGVTSRAIMNDAGEPPTLAVAEVLSQYVLRCPDEIPGEDRRVTFRELDGAGPLVSRFADNTHRLIAETFGARLQDLQAVAGQMGAQPQGDGTGFDLFVRFNALPRVPLYLQFNAADDLFPAQAALLFQISAQSYLDMGSLFKVGTYLAGRLISAGTT